MDYLIPILAVVFALPPVVLLWSILMLEMARTLRPTWNEFIQLIKGKETQ